MAATDDVTTQAARFLHSATSYPEAPPQVEVRETHISWVFLAGRFAYKLKKPVQFDFLDFSTVELRKKYCEEELQLNRRFSPDVYLGVLPICQTMGGKLKLGGEGRPIDWVVKMRRLDDRRTLAAHIARRDLTNDQVDALGKRLISIYVGQAPLMIRAQAYCKTLAEHVRANREELLELLPNQRADIEYVHAAQNRHLYLMEEQFNDRVCDGRVIDGHGDLRPEHIYLEKPPRIIDCIEFNAEYRRIDILDDLGFLAMECDRLGAGQVGQRLIDAYCEVSHDHARPALLAFYKSYRACVREKVAALRSHQTDGISQQPTKIKTQTYLQLAKKYADQLGKRVIILVGGLTGTGKSSLAGVLAERLDAKLLQTDLIRRELFPAQEPSDLFGQGKYDPKQRTRVYEAMIARAGTCLSQNPTVVLDGTFSSQNVRQLARDLSRCKHTILLQVQCDCPREVAIRRISERLRQGTSASEARPEFYDRQADVHEGPLPDTPLCVVDTTLPLAAQVDRVRHITHDLFGTARPPGTPT